MLQNVPIVQEREMAEDCAQRIKEVKTGLKHDSKNENFETEQPPIELEEQAT